MYKPQLMIACVQCTEVGFASFLSGGFITAIVVNPPERKLVKRTSGQYCSMLYILLPKAIPLSKL